MDPSNPHWGWSWLERWMATRPHENGNATSKEPNSDHKQSRPPSRQSPSTPKSKITPSPKIRPREANGTDDDLKSNRSGQSYRYRRHSIAGSSVRDDDSITSSQATVRGYMASTESTRAKSRVASPVGRTPEKGAVSSAKKRLSFSGSPAGSRRHSGPPRIDISPMKDITTY